MRKLAYIVVCLLIPVVAMAQQRVYGKVTNHKDGSALEMATVRLMKDSAMVQGVTTDLDGFYLLSNVQKGRYVLVVNSMGFTEKRVPLHVADKDVEMATVQMKEDVHVLAEVDVKGQAAEMTVKGDTLEYNTSAYKMGENAMVEDLLKKMNGVSVDKEGNVTVNGETITAVRIDGKKFFGNDVQTATKNIPAEMIEKIQVVDEKSDMAKITGIEDENTERIINLQLKQNRKKGMFGNYKGALGTDMLPEATDFVGWLEDDFRYNASTFTNIMLGESQTTVIAGANNTNEIMMGRGRGGFGSQNQGITRAENIGVNTNVDLTSKIEKKDAQSSMLFGGDVALNHNINNTRTDANKTTYSGDMTYLNHDSTAKVSKVWDANLRLELEYRIDTLNKLLVKPNISYTNSRSDNLSTYQYSRDEEQIKNGRQTRLSNSEDISAKLQIVYSHKFHKPGRSLSLDGNASLTNTKGFNKTLAENLLTGRNDVDQHADTKRNTIAYGLKMSWVEPIYGRNHFLETALSMNGNTRLSDKDQMSIDTITGSKTEGEYVYDSLYSNSMRNYFFSEALEVNYRWVDEKYDLTVGMKVNPSQTHSINYYGGVLSRDTLRSVWNWSPNASFRYKMGKRNFVRLRYRGQSSQPSVDQMEPVRNNSNAMSETVGNLGLNPAFKHNIYLMYSKFNQENFSGMMTGLRANLTKDALVNNTLYDETGKAYCQTVNANGLPWDISADLMYNTPFCNKLMQFHTRTAVSYNQRLAYVSREQKAEDIVRMIDADAFMLGDESKTGNVSVSEDLSLRLTHNIVDLGVNGRVNYSYTHNSLSGSTASHVVNWTISGDVEFHLPKNWNISTDIGYTARYGYQLSDVNEILWNAEVSKTWGNATLAIQAYDMLQQKKNIVQVVGENYVRYEKYNTLPTYVMLNFTYKLNRMGSLKAKGAAGFMQDVLEGNFDPAKGKMPSTPPPGPRPGA